jgi:hypothetical protein
VIAGSSIKRFSVPEAHEQQSKHSGNALVGNALNGNASAGNASQAASNLHLRTIFSHSEALPISTDHRPRADELVEGKLCLRSPCEPNVKHAHGSSAPTLAHIESDPAFASADSAHLPDGITINLRDIFDFIDLGPLQPLREHSTGPSQYIVKCSSGGSNATKQTDAETTTAVSYYSSQSIAQWIASKLLAEDLLEATEVKAQVINDPLTALTIREVEVFALEPNKKQALPVLSYALNNVTGNDIFRNLHLALHKDPGLTVISSEAKASGTTALIPVRLEIATELAITLLTIFETPEALHEKQWDKDGNSMEKTVLVLQSFFDNMAVRHANFSDWETPITSRKRFIRYAGNILTNSQVNPNLAKSDIVLIHQKLNDIREHLEVAMAKRLSAQLDDE